MIPRHLHRVWICPPGPPMPAEFAGYGAGWRERHPDWTVTEWADTAALEPLVNADLYADPPAKHLHRCRADVVRLEALWRFGGVYVDTDVEPLRSLDPLLERVARVGATAFVAWSANRWRGRPVVSNAVLGAVPAHPWIAKAMAELPRSVERHRGEMLARMTVHYLTDLLGPLNRDGVSRDGVLVLEARTFYPQSIAARDAGHAPDLTGAYGWHHWANTRDRRAQ